VDQQWALDGSSRDPVLLSEIQHWDTEQLNRRTFLSMGKMVKGGRELILVCREQTDTVREVCVSQRWSMYLETNRPAPGYSPEDSASHFLSLDLS
jgi:hypothetical protein